MNITIIGASSGLGLETVKRALERNHQVITLSRSEVQLPEHPNLIKLKGDATKKEDVVRSISGTDALIVTLGTGQSRKPTTLYSDFARLLLEIHKAKKLSIPVIVLTGFGAGNSAKYNSLIMRILFWLLLKDVYADKTAMEETIATSGMRWVIARPGRLTDGPLTEEYRVENRLFKGVNIGSISRSDVADYLVRQAENPIDLFRYPALSEQ
ncbi:NAD(P)-dependent oxidoreductase [Emticicia soli]|uniref:NAD(P)-dependent oxidoreductase n=1 Tax=Emticicia soli TaxID=2027878 RepID=A0ABW5J9J3_9BACT